MIVEPAQSPARAPRHLSNTNGASKCARNAESSGQEELNEVDQIIEQIMTDGSIDGVSHQNHKQIINKLKKIQTEAMDNSEYARAEMANNGIRQTLNYVTLSQFSDIQNAKTDDLCDKLETAQNDLLYLKEHWKSVYKSALQRREEDLTALREEHEAELAEFDEKFEEEIPPKFRRFSPELLQLRKRQQAMVISKRYVEATCFKNEADELELKEIEANTNAYHKRLEADRKKLLKRQEEKEFVRSQNWARNLHEIDKISAYEIDHAKKAVEHLEQQIANTPTLSLQEPTSPATSRSTRSRTLPNKTNTINTSDLSGPKAFRQRALINHVTYTKVFTPKIRKSQPHSAR